MTTELFILAPDPTGISESNVWNRVELMEDVSIPITFNIADIVDFTKKNASFSKTIVIPGSKENNKLFKHII